MNSTNNGTATVVAQILYCSELQGILKSASRNRRSATVRQANNFTAALVTTGCAKVNVTMMETGKCICKYFLLRDIHLKVENNTIHNNITPGGITDMVKPQACTGFIMDSRKTQSARRRRGKKKVKKKERKKIFKC